MPTLATLVAAKPHLLPPPARAPESAAVRQQRQLDLTRELADLNMLAARDAGSRIAAGAAAPDPTLALARATRAVTAVIALENRIAAGEVAPAGARPAGDAGWIRAAGLCRRPDPAPRPLHAHLGERMDDEMDGEMDSETEAETGDALGFGTDGPTLAPGLPLAPATARASFPELPLPPGTHPPPRYHPRL